MELLKGRQTHYMTKALNTNMEKISNIIDFPVKRKFNIDESKDLQRELLNNKMEYVDELLEFYTAQLCAKFAMHGFKIHDETFLKDFAFSIETIRSSLYRNMGVTHPFQGLMDDTVDTMEKKGWIKVPNDD